jgi:hypothetical protein
MFVSMLHAQIPAPVLECVRGDTVFWTPVPAGCGPVTGYKVYGSQNVGGTYFLLANINNPAQTTFYHSGATGTWYYFVQTKASCPNPAALSSDTLSNAPPLTPRYTTISVTGGGILLTWLPVPGSSNMRYVIHRITMAGTVPIDTVSGQLSYLDTQSPGTLKAEQYFITALDPCGNQSAFGTVQNSVFLSVATNTCERSLTCTWNAFNGWPAGVATYRILLSVNKGPYQIIDSIGGGGARKYDIMNLKNADNYCIRIQSVAADSGWVSESNTVCIDPVFVEGTGDFYIRSITVNGQNQPVIEWRWNPAAQLKYAALEKGPSGVWSSAELIPVTPPLKLTNSVIHLLGDAGKGPLTYRMQATDTCNNITSTEAASTIFAQAGQGIQATNDIRWTPLSIPQVATEYYRVFRGPKGGAVLFHLQVDKDSLHLVDPYQIDNPDEADLCYLIEAVGTLTTPQGKKEQVSSRSNLACVARTALIWAPNAFTPTGKNPEFKPVLLYAFNAGYIMKVFNRWGEQVFESKDPDIGWNGVVHSSIAPPGVYAYVIQVTLPNGSVSEKKGTVALVR